MRPASCLDCDWLTDRVARLTVMVRRTAAAAHDVARHPAAGWHLCTEEPCASVKRQLDQMKSARSDEEMNVSKC